jgi:Holliday junction DNA helicase RuvA
MIGRLTGTVISCAPDRVLLDVAGVGYEVSIPLSTFYSLPRESGARASLRIHTHVREDALQLYGFASHEERAAFELLIGISGVGPRMALGILSGIGAGELRTTVAQQDRARLQKIPGVGKKTAERLLLELRDKMEAAAPAAAGAAQSLRPDAISALVNLGYSKDVAERAVDRALERPESGDDLEGLLRTALGGLVR